MKPYPKYKDSGVKWIGKVPEGWEVKRIKYFFRLITEKNSTLKTKKVALENIESWTGRFIDSEVDYQGEGISFLKGDVLFGKLRPYLAKVLNAKFSGASVGDIFVMRPKLGISSRFAFYRFLSKPFIDIVNGSTFGAKMPRASWNFIANLYIAVPDYDEQSAIAAYLDRKTTQIDDLISKKQKLIELLKEERAAIINQAVTKGLNPDAPMKDSGIEWLGKVPEHWEVKRLKYVIALFDHKRVPLSGEERGKMTNKIYDYYGASGIIDRVDDYIFDGEYILIGEDGANLLARNSPLAFKAIGKFWVNNHAHILKPKYGSLDYFTNLLESIDYTIWVSGSAQPKLTAENLANIEIVEPPLKDQTMIVQFIEEKTLKIDNYISKIYQKIELLKEYRTALISEAVTGKIDVRNEGSNG